MEEKKFLRKVISFFTPIGGFFVDGYEGAFKTSIAAIQCRRQVVVVEKDVKCFQMASERL